MGFSVGGLLLVGFGVSLIGESIQFKANYPEGWGWVAYGTLALCVFNAGISCFGRGVIERIKILHAEDRL